MRALGDELPGQGALAVVRKNQGAGTIEGGGHSRECPLLQRPGDVFRRLAVRSHHLLAVRDDTSLQRGGPRRVGQQVFRGDAGLAEDSSQSARRVVFSQDADQPRLAAQAVEVVGDVGGATEVKAVAGDLDDRNRRLRGDARHAPPHELVQHEISDDHDLSTSSRPQNGRRALRRDAAQETLPSSCPLSEELRSSTIGIAIAKRNSIRNSESPKLYSKSPAVMPAIKSAREPAASARSFVPADERR